ncbi:sigma-70 family RNA polymerase sigma factor [Ruminococcus sp.]|uniref:RNA polymerase sigma factor n=1 Tax=Ruminococcus sp. TaxID=41978 RepID=UPI0025FFA252|nr:sigma-70 family RNA polymerase sigma factor [Ruminococcus sp.]MCR4637870.1 sigma-70 family RNA polymerase sigma factor [Ruminococcus sp.]
MTYDESEKLKKLYEVYEQPMYRIAYAVLHDEGLAEDAVSDAFIRIMRRLARLNECTSDKTKAYIVKVIKSTSINIYRKNKRRYNEEVPIDNAVQIADRTLIYSDQPSINEILGGLGETDRKIVTLRCVDELSWREVAEKLSLTEVNVRKRFERTKKRLRSKGEIDNEK